MNITAALLQRDEEDHIGAALDSVDWYDEVVGVDSRSVDRTRVIAERHGGSVINAPRPAPDEPQDQFRLLGVESVLTDFVLLLDADERLPTGLQSHLQEPDVDREIKLIYTPASNYLGDEPLVAFVTERKTRLRTACDLSPQSSHNIL